MRRCQKWAFGCTLISLSDCRQNMLIMSSILLLTFEILLEILKTEYIKISGCIVSLNVTHEWNKVLFLFSGLKWTKRTELKLLLIQFSSQFSLFVGLSVFPSTKIAAVLLCLWLNATKKSAIQWRHFFFWEQGPKDDFSGLYFTVGSHKNPQEDDRKSLGHVSTITSWYN